MTCPSKEILTVIRTEQDGDQQNSTLIGANARAEEFNGRKSGMTITGTESQKLIELVSNWMDPPDFEAVFSEQKELYAKVQRGEEIYATVPLRINDNHPIPSIRGCEFLPITIAYSKPQMIAEKRIEYHVVMYLNLESVKRTSNTSLNEIKTSS